MSEIIAPDYLSPNQSQMVRDLYEAFNEFKTTLVPSVFFDRDKQSEVVMKFNTLQVEFPEIAELAHQNYHRGEESDDEDDLLEMDIEGMLFWLFLALLEFAGTTDSVKLDNISVFLEGDLIEVSRFCEGYDASRGVWN
jgi:hypothetical protein